MRREVRISLGVLAALLVLLAVIVVRRMTSGSDLPPAALPGAANDTGDAPSVTTRPIVVATDRASHSSDAPVAPSTIESTESDAAPFDSQGYRPPPVSFMPRTSAPPLFEEETPAPTAAPDGSPAESHVDEPANSEPPRQVPSTTADVGSPSPQPSPEGRGNDISREPVDEQEQVVELPKQRLVAPLRPRSRIGGAQPAIESRAASTTRSRDTSHQNRYTVRPGDTLWSIAQRTYGSGAYFRALAQANRERVPHADEVTVGIEVLLPDLAELQRRFPHLCPKAKTQPTYIAAEDSDDHASETPPPGSRVYVVEEGDTLIEIARYELGDAAKWETIVQANRRLLRGDPNHISPGMKLVLPPKGARVADVARSGNQPQQEPISGGPALNESEAEAAALLPAKMKNLKR
jgi:nucleoid-associated protein YgaU